MDSGYRERLEAEAAERAILEENARRRVERDRINAERSAHEYESSRGCSDLRTRGKTRSDLSL
jgi:hypothetical protein